MSIQINEQKDVITKRTFVRIVRAQLRDSRVLFQESRFSLLLFVAIILGGALIFHFFYTYPGTGEHPDFAEALHASFALVFFETLLPFPEQGALQLLFASLMNPLKVVRRIRRYL